MFSIMELINYFYYEIWKDIKLGEDQVPIVEFLCRGGGTYT